MHVLQIVRWHSRSLTKMRAIRRRARIFNDPFNWYEVQGYRKSWPFDRHVQQIILTLPYPVPNMWRWIPRCPLSRKQSLLSPFPQPRPPSPPAQDAWVSLASKTTHTFILRLCWHDELVSWCFEPSQPQRITSGLNTNVTLSSSYSFHKSSYHKSCIF